MKNMNIHPAIRTVVLPVTIAVLGTLHTHAQYTFDSGSDGSYGPMNITSNTTLALPPDGIFHCTTINVASNVTLKFTPNALNSPVYLLATTNVTISGTIDVSGSTGTGLWGGVGGPGGFKGGGPGSQDLPAGEGHGPGAGKAGTGNDWPNAAGYGAYGSTSTFPHGRGNGAPYGSALLLPLVGGSGGGGGLGWGGTGGGGAICIASGSSISVTGNLLANAGAFSSGMDAVGSGGAIRLVAPAVTGSGSLDVTGARGQIGIGSPPYAYYSGAGRIRIDCLDRRSLSLSCIPNSVTTIGVNMVSIPTNAPRLDVVQVGANAIPVGTAAPVVFMLPSGASTNQNVTVQARNFGRIVPIRVVLTPDNGPSSSYDSQIDNTASPASVTVPVIVPVNVMVHVNAWTR